MLSVILPVFNGAAYLSDAIHSILQQHPEEFELIIVDDGSTDQTAEIAKRAADGYSNIIYLRQSNQGPSAARNLGIRQARGSWIGFIDADDLWSPKRIARHNETMRIVPDAEVIQGMLQQFGSHTKAPEWAVQVGTGLFKKTIFEKIGLFNETLFYGEDFDFWVRLYEKKVKIQREQAIVLYYRVHEGSMTFGTKPASTQATCLQIVRSSLERRRADG